MSQLGLFPTHPTAPPHRGQPSQIEGARKIEPKVSRLQQIVLEAIDAHANGASIEQIVNRTGLKIQTVCGRVGELKHLGKIKEASFTRKAASGVNVKVWVQA